MASIKKDNKDLPETPKNLNSSMENTLYSITKNHDKYVLEIFIFGIYILLIIK